ncbi:hypothetical protein M3Y99_00730200 [Aphelenchoides fujianensis]|nr:hypothetical protein M3Y99_00730200 [Aphelenchoides fujianensis]
MEAVERNIALFTAAQKEATVKFKGGTFKEYSKGRLHLVVHGYRLVPQAPPLQMDGNPDLTIDHMCAKVALENALASAHSAAVIDLAMLKRSHRAGGRRSAECDLWRRDDAKPTATPASGAMGSVASFASLLGAFVLFFGC